MLSDRLEPCRTEFYTDLFARAKIASLLLRLVRESDSEKEVRVTKIETGCQDGLKKKILGIGERLAYLTSLIPGKLKDKTLIEEFNINFDNIRALQECIPRDCTLSSPLQTVADNIGKDVMRDVTDRLVSFRQDMAAKFDPGGGDDGFTELIINGLVPMKAVSIQVPALKTKADSEIDTVLLDIKKMPNGVSHIGRLGLLFDQVGKDEPLAQVIIADHAIFKGYSLSLRNEKTKKFTVKDVLDKIDVGPGNVLNVVKLAEIFADFDAEYWGLVEKGLLNPAEQMKEIVQQAKMLAKEPANHHVVLRRLCSHLFAYWTLSKTEYYAEVRSFLKGTVVDSVLHGF